MTGFWFSENAKLYILTRFDAMTFWKEQKLIMRSLFKEKQNQK